MKNKTLKIIIILNVILFLSSPIISSISSIKISKNDSTELIENISETNHIDPKIVSAIQMVTESLLKEYMSVLTVEIGPRVTGTYGCEEAAKYIFKQFENMDLETRYHNWQGLNYRKPPKYYKSQNIEGTLKGIDKSNDEILVFNAHYDTIKDSPGAIDDGSGTVAVMAAAYVLSQFDFNRTIKFVAFSGEEVGIIGSRTYVRDLYKKDTNILVEFNADMIGFSDESEEVPSVYISPSEDAKWILNEIKKVNNNYGIGFNIKSWGTISSDGDRSGSDFYDFLLHGYESIAFWQSGRYDYYHSPEDTIDKVNFSYLANMTKLIVASIAHMADIDVYYPQITIGAPKRGRYYFEDRTLFVFKYERIRVINDVLICTKVKPGNASIEKVEFYYDGKLMFSDTDMPYQWRLNKLSIRKHTVEVILYDTLGRTASDKVTFRYINLNRNR
ncbi:hypothetical protein AYK24_09980 [Thermoplasmatales archaeon SG8-52-4]|nr:MAG: hypothetical protein AYK24_09980 [Thermoplasmatales archaeon SG8-52-4]